MKDNFSNQSDKYLKYRPAYPSELFTLINALVPSGKNSWDCATGNGQVANRLSKSFENVYATDISANQMSQGGSATNVHYSVQPAEKTNFKDNQFDLITVGQAIHWFNFDKFYAEVKRTSKPGGILLVTGYGLHKIEPRIDQIIHRFYFDIIGPYWDDERKYIDDAYQTLPFPFKELPHAAFTMKCEWTFDHFIGYLNTWSAVKHYIKKNGANPINEIMKELEFSWGNSSTKLVEFPLLLRIGQVK